MQRLLLWAVVLVIGVPCVGCGPNLSERELGEVVYEMPKFAEKEPAKKSPETTAPATPEMPASDSATDAPASPQK